MLNKEYLDEIMQSLTHSASLDSQVVVFLEAGHYNPSYGATEFSKTSLQDALLLAKMLIKTFGQKMKIVLGILIDDLGLECSTNSCSISQATLKNSVKSPEHLLPTDLEELLSASPIVKRDRLVISSEKTCKNRGLLKLKNLVKANVNNIVIEHGIQDSSGNKIIFQDDESNHILLAEFSASVWKAKCPTIMGQHYVDCFNKLKQRFSHLQKFILIDWTEMLDYAKVTAGSQAAFKVFVNKDLDNLHLEIYNIFFGDDLGETYEIKEFIRPSFVEAL